MSDKRKKVDWNNPKVQYEVFKLARDGATQKEIAEKLKVGLTTVKHNLSKNSTLRNLYKKGIELSDLYMLPDIETAFKKSCLGYTVEEKHVTKKFVGDPNSKLAKLNMETTMKMVKKHYAPSVTAQIFALVNRGDYSSINKIINEINHDDRETEYDVIKNLYEGKHDFDEGK